jgi:hypothetical protein
LKWSAVEKCSKKDGVELLINCSISGIIRNVDNERANITIEEFLGDSCISSKPSDIMHQYRKKLKKHFKRVIEKPIKTSRKTVVYYLLFDTNNPTGFKIMPHVMKAGGEQKKIF